MCDVSLNPFSVYVRNRPVRVAFLADPTAMSDERLDAIFEYNLIRWGGRLNPINFSDGGQIGDEAWKFLAGFDPDVVVPLMSLGVALKDRINRLVSPLALQDYRDPGNGIRFSIHTHKDGLCVYPEPETLRSSRPERNHPLLEPDY